MRGWKNVIVLKATDSVTVVMQWWLKHFKSGQSMKTVGMIDSLTIAGIGKGQPRMGIFRKEGRTHLLGAGVHLQTSTLSVYQE